MKGTEKKLYDAQEQEVPPELSDRKIYNTPIGPVCMSKTEHEAYLEEKARRERQQKNQEGREDTCQRKR
jgi:hypothetical protein